MKRNFKIIEEGTTYKLPKYRVVDGKGIQEVKKRVSPYIDVNGKPIKEGDVVVGVGTHVGQSEVFFVNGNWQPFDYLQDFNGDNYKVIDSLDIENQTITFVRGDKTDNGTIIPRVDGILHEQLLAMMINDLQYKSKLVPSRETSIAITKLQEALMWLEERQRDRENRNIQGTYTK